MDKIVAAAPMRDFILLFTEQGLVYRVVWNEPFQTIEIRLETSINLGVR